MRDKRKKRYKVSNEDAERVKKLSGFGLTHEQIAQVIGITRPTLTKYYEHELELGKAEALETATNALFFNIKKGKEASIFFYLKCRHRWSEKAQELTDETIEKIAMGVNRARNMSHSEWEELVQKEQEKTKQKTE
jgi:DNA-binding XRE family transcriptional regulator